MLGLFRSKRITFISLVIALFGVIVSGISTFAWFQIQTSVSNVTKSNIVSSGSSELEIQSVTGYKYEYDQTSFGVTDYNNGHVIPYTAYGTANIEDPNIDQGSLEPSDYPVDGSGYYIVGNEFWISVYNEIKSASVSAAKTFKYAAGLRFNNDPTDSYFGIYRNLHFPAGCVINVRHYYFTGKTPSDVSLNWDNTLETVNNETGGPYIAQSGDNIEIKRGGTFDLFITKAGKLNFSLIEADLLPAGKIRGNYADGPKKAFQGNNKRIYLTNPGENDNNAVYSTWVQGGGITSAWYAVDQTITIGSTPYMYVDVPKEATECKFVRYSDYLSGTTWDGNTVYWNEATSNSNITNNNSFSFTGYSSNKMIISSGSLSEGNIPVGQSLYFNPGTYNDVACAAYFYNDIISGIDAKWVKMTLEDSWKNYSCTIPTPDDETYYVWSGVVFVVLNEDTTPSDFSDEAVSRQTVDITSLSNTLFTATGLSGGKMTGSWSAYYAHNTIAGGSKLFLNTNGTAWSNSDAGLFVFLERKDKHVWVEMSLVIKNYYYIQVPSSPSIEWDKIVFCRLNPENTNHDWNSGGNNTNVYHQTADLEVSDTYNCYRITSVGNMAANPAVKATGSWNEALNWNVDNYQIWVNGAYISENLDISGTNSNLFSKLVDLDAGDDVLIKLIDIDSSVKNYNIGYSQLTSTVGITPGTDGAARVGTTGQYLVYFDKSTAKLTVMAPDFKVVHSTSTDHPWPVEDITTYSMERQGESTVFQAEIDMDANSEFKVYNATTGTWYGYDHTVVIADKLSNEIYRVGGSEDNKDNIRVVIEGTYTVAFDVSTDTISVTGDFDTDWIESRKTYYLNCSQGSWAANIGGHNPKFPAWAYDNSGHAEWIEPTKIYDSGVDYSYEIPEQAVEVIFCRMDSTKATGWVNNLNQTNTVALASITTGNYSYVQGVDGGTGKFTLSAWQSFYAEPGITERGYYLVGNEDFTGSNLTAWTCGAGFKMEAVEANDQHIVAVLHNVALDSDMQFKIWEYDDAAITGSGRSHDWGAETLDYSDSETTGTDGTDGVAIGEREGLEIDGKLHYTGNIKINENVIGEKFTIYLLNNSENYSIRIHDDDAGADIFFNSDVTVGSVTVSAQTAIAMGDGSGNYFNISEIGITVTKGVEMAIRSKQSGSFHWYGGEHIGSDLSTGDDLEASALPKEMGDEKATNTLTTLKFVNSGRYYIYLDSDGNVDVARMATKGDGYYLLPYEHKNDCDAIGGYKMKSISSVGTTNNAVYTSFSVLGVDPNDSDTYKSYAINSFFDRQTGTAISNISTHSTAQDYVDIDGDKITIKDNGSYNFYVYNNGTQISITKNPLSDFFSLNSIPSKQWSGSTYTSHNAESVKSANTTLIIAVSFTTSGTKAHPLLPSIEAIVNESVEDGLSEYAKVACFYDTDNCAQGNCYQTLRSLIYGANSSGFNTISSTTSIAPVDQTNITDGKTHWAYIVIDYNPSTVATMPETIYNDMTFAIKVSQA